MDKTITKLYVLEWDGWSFEGIFIDKRFAHFNKTHCLENIREVEVEGVIVDDYVFIPMDGKNDWVGVYSNNTRAEARLKEIPFKHDYKTRKIKIVTK